MPRITARHIKVEQDEEHIIRRLGKAIVWQWDELPANVQQTILEQAVLVHDTYDAVRLDQQIGMFIRNNKGRKDA